MTTIDEPTRRMLEHPWHSPAANVTVIAADGGGWFVGPRFRYSANSDPTKPPDIEWRKTAKLCRTQEEVTAEMRRLIGHHAISYSNSIHTW